ncbi:BatD family protein [Vibrio gallaecicus]|uniref:BatD family protein n=1 Tax=Vibrio gallaecicus TaxID=552386 RepID=UPI0025B5FCF6|nr:BatD family protein [Vibrio gallaecicus]MDN3617749.1 BatD family protein [Vibrio gallaecicus]
MSTNLTCRTLLSSCLLLLLLVTSNSFSMEISDLSHRGSLQVNAWVDDAHGGNSTHSNNYSRAFSVHEQVTVNIEILSDTWFTKGTHIHRFEVDNAVVLSNQLHSINSTKRLNGKTYSQQIWEVVVYPLQSGEFLIPSITIELEIKTSAGVAVKMPMKIKTIRKKIAM